MVGIEIITYTCFVLKLRPTASYRQLNLSIEQIFFDMQLLLHILFNTVVGIVECHNGKCLQSTYAVFQCQVIVGIPFVVLPRLTGSHQTETITLGLQRLDTDHGIYLGTVLGTWSGDDIDALDIYRLELFQFVKVAYLFIIYIDLRFALG